MNLVYKKTNIFFTDTGSGTTVVLLHGFLESSRVWKPFIPVLSKNKRVICIDLFGHGKTGNLNPTHTMLLMAEGVHAVLQHLNITHAVFIGHSMGGYVALAFAEKYPEFLTGLCLVNSTTEADSVERKINRERAIEAVKFNREKFIRIAISSLFGYKNRLFFSSEIKHLIDEALQMSLEGIVAALQGMILRKDRTHLLRNNSFKQMMIIGVEDPILDYKKLMALTHNTLVRVVVFQGGHMSFIEDKMLFLQKIMHFIEKK